MYLQEDGDVLEKGANDDGREYEELWTELEIDVIPEEGMYFSEPIIFLPESSEVHTVKMTGSCFWEELG